MPGGGAWWVMSSPAVAAEPLPPAAPDAIAEEASGSLADTGPACVSCGHPTGEPYCARCGERRAADRGYSLRHFASEAFETVTNVDGTAWRTLRTLVTRPGALTAAYMRGERVPWMKPLQLFLIVNVIYFVWVAFAGERVFSTPLSGHLQNSNYGETARQLILARVQQPGMTPAEINEAANAYGERFNDAAAVQAKSLIITMVPMFAALVALVQVRRRRPAVQHLVFALHVFTTLLLLAIAQRYLLHLPLRALGIFGSEAQANRILNELIGIFMMSAMAVYTGLGLRRAYGDGVPAAIVKGAFLGWSLLLVLGLYRYLLFYTVYWATG
jgi:hypothetical protein